ncbi:hypothetical protein BGW38_004908 [Lunasporangiospora selenospora]|uniref:Uncharacterized protein n=1 Tax=Lunasporangiospora selenospora TaxID=979761 RepID=A0A9P6FPI6_9FUNG|nr:hypothetical protein BGW38_004908 [Lunasporangiospora selenospora]
MEMFGNWVRRWQSDDSELFFAFYRHYHHCLSHFLGAPLQRIQAGGWATSAITPKVYAGAPGYLYLSAFFLTKIEGLVHREIHPVTTIVQFEPNSANGNSNPGVERDRAMASVATGEFPGTTAPPAVRLPNGSEDVNARSKDGAPTTGKPKVLDMASRRFVETIVSIMEDHGNIYGAMLDVWIRAAVTRTSVYDVESVFCLLDFLDMLISELEARTTIRLYDSELSTVPLHTGPSVTFVPIHVQFILTTLHLLLTSSDHTITLMRTISFIYQNFTLLTGTVQTLEQLTLGTLLSPAVFEKCFLHWARNVRLYYMRCLVWRVARIGGGVGILPGWKGWTTPTVPALDQQSYLAGRGGSGGMMATANAASPEVPLKKKSKEAASVPRSNSLELSLASIVRNIFEVMESRVDMVKRQYSGELLTDLMPRLGDKDPELSPPCSTPSSPNPENGPTTTPAVVVSAGGSPVDPASTRARFSTEGNQEEDSLGASRSFYQLQAQQIYLAHQTLTSPPNSGTKDKEGSKKSSSRSSLIGRKFRRLSRSDGSSLTNTEPSRSNSMDSDATLCESFQNLQAGGGGSSSPKRSSSGSSPSITSPGSLLRWMFLGGQSSNKMGSSSNNGYVGADMNGLNRSVSDRLFSTSSCSLVSRSTDSSTSLSIAMKNSDQSPESSRQQVNSTGQDRRDAQARARASLRYVYESRRYPEHLTIYAERSIPEHTAVLNEYVDWLGQCHAYGIKTRMSYAVNGGLANQGQPGGVPGIGLCSNLSGSSLNNGTGSGMGGNGQFGDVFGDFCIFSLSVGEVMDASAVANHQEEWISPGMAQMMMLRFPGLAVEWPKFWNNSRDLSGPPPGPITTLPALAVVNNPAFSLSKGGAGGIGGGVSAGAGGHFGGTSLNGPYSVNGPSSLRHQQQAQMHHQQQMQLWSRNAAVAAQMAAAQAAQAATHMAQANTVMVSSVGTDEASTRSIQTPQDRFLFSPSALT